MSSQEIEQHSSQQRDRLVSLQESMLWAIKVIGTSLLVTLLGAIWVAVADHYKLVRVESAMTNLASALTTTADAQDRATIVRVAEWTAWRTKLNLDFTKNTEQIEKNKSKVDLLAASFGNVSNRWTFEMQREYDSVLRRSPRDVNVQVIHDNHVLSLQP